MIPAYTAAEVVAAERPLLEAGRGEALMRRAAAGLAGVCREVLSKTRGQVSGTRVLVLVGAGNNGGDALFAGANLASRGAHVTALDLLGRAHPIASRAFRAAGGILTEPDPSSPHDLASADLVLDGILGTGARPGLPPQVRGLLLDRAAVPRESRPLVVAVDAPTGLDATTGVLEDVHVSADHTVTFGVAKTGLLVPEAAAAVGTLHVVDIGLDLTGVRPGVELLEDADVAASWPVPDAHAHKYTRGVLGLVAGSPSYPGAGVLAARAAVAAGVGMLRVVGPAALVDAVPEAVRGPGRVQAWALGPGAPAESDMRAALGNATVHGLPLVLDAGALGLVDAGFAAGPGPHAVLTPHAGELAAMLGALTPDAPTRAEIEARPSEFARRAASASGSTVLLKGHRTVIARPDGTLVVCPPGPANLATAGAGDVLTGLLGALLATSASSTTGPADLAHLAGCAVNVHNSAGKVTTHASGLPPEIEARAIRMTHHG